MILLRFTTKKNIGQFFIKAIAQANVLRNMDNKKVFLNWVLTPGLHNAKRLPALQLRSSLINHLSINLSDERWKKQCSQMVTAISLDLNPCDIWPKTSSIGGIHNLLSKKDNKLFSKAEGPP